MDKYKLRIGEEEYWECGDGCCSDYLTDIYINDIEIGTFSYFRESEGLYNLVEYLNKCEESKLIIKMIPEESHKYDYDWDNFIHIGDTKIKYDDFEHYRKLLKALKINYELHEYEIDHASYSNGEFKLEDEVYIETYEF